ncbi:beta-channel forming cytolysin [Bacillus thuringiensis]|uniref:beta-channel forming cytolysin n=1 Tax=Bacillus thuringiensis TaxID=1428 RepID=UPI001E56D4CF|nr:beta-channel forming cytolysin [Bacillus thuringiensis]MCC2544718.1 beta-channel forming cytolysin [Bacillus thuringiensis]MCU4998148.1 beta-channel forming cytolysin [Bacillus cereus]
MKDKKCMLKKITITSIIMWNCFTLNLLTANADTKIESIVDIGENGQNAKVYNNFSTLFDEQAKIKTSLLVSIIDDPYSNKQIAVIKTDGSNISANKSVEGLTDEYGHEAGYMSAVLKWASSYNIGMELTNENSQFYKVSPINTIDTKTITSSIGYNIGGEIKVSDKADGGGSVGMNWSTSTSYDQPDYKTVLETDTANKVQWRIPFISTMNQGYGPYNRESDDSIYRNQLFMKSRNAATWAKDNFISSDEMPALASYGFSPGMIAVVIADKSEDISTFKITYTRNSDDYRMDWTSFFNGVHGSGAGWWVGGNIKDVSKGISVHNYSVDWKNHRLIEN